MQFSYQNHFKFGYDGSWFCRRSTPEQAWVVRYGRSHRKSKNWYEECIETARLIRQQTKLDLWVLLSGGIDSEVVLRSFVAAKIEVRTAIMRFRNNLNEHDIQYAVKTCDELRVAYKIFELDIVDFFESRKAFEYVELAYPISPQFVATMWLMDQVPGYPILGSGECYLVKRNLSHLASGFSQAHFTPDGLNNDEEQWDLWEKENVASWYRFLLAREKEGCAGFFQYNPENMLAFLLDEDVQQLTANKIEGKVSTASSKYKIYKKYFPLIERPKYTGYERLQGLDRKYRESFLKKNPAANGIYRTPFAELLRQLSPLC